MLKSWVMIGEILWAYFGTKYWPWFALNHPKTLLNGSLRFKFCIFHELSHLTKFTVSQIQKKVGAVYPERKQTLYFVSCPLFANNSARMKTTAHKIVKRNACEIKSVMWYRSCCSVWYTKACVIVWCEWQATRGSWHYEWGDFFTDLCVIME